MGAFGVMVAPVMSDMMAGWIDKLNSPSSSFFVCLALLALLFLWVGGNEFNSSFFF
jgi:hypothetical protein